MVDSGHHKIYSSCTDAAMTPAKHADHAHDAETKNIHTSLLGSSAFLHWSFQYNFKLNDQAFRFAVVELRADRTCAPMLFPLKHA